MHRKTKQIPIHCNHFVNILPFLFFLSFLIYLSAARIWLPPKIFLPLISPFWLIERDMTDMATSGNCSKNAVILILLLLIFSITFSQPISVVSVSESESGTREKELVIGSRPPQCVNKCLNCHPCVAALVVSQRHRNQAVKELLPKDDSYYLLSWKCKCKDKYFQP